jgi:hypothetical protein
VWITGSDEISFSDQTTPSPTLDATVDASAPVRLRAKPRHVNLQVHSVLKLHKHCLPTLNR